MNIVSVNVARSISANVKSTMVTNSVNKYIRYKILPLFAIIVQNKRVLVH